MIKKIILYLKYWDENSLYRWAISEKLLADCFRWTENTSQFNKDFIEYYNEDRNEGYVLEVDIQDPEKTHDLHNDLPFSPKRTKIEKVEKVVATLHDKKEYFIHIRNLNQALNIEKSS